MKLLGQFAGVFLVFPVAATFTVAISAFQVPLKKEPVKIGLLISGEKSTAALQGAELAIKKANREGGMNGRPFELVVKSLEGPWGTGSKQAVNLIFDENVWAMLGSQDGRNAHLIEQVSAKTRVVFMSSWTGDPTLAQAFVPWFFNCVPNDRQQAATLLNEIYRAKASGRPVIISDDSYDSRSLEKNFLEEVRRSGKTKPAKFIFNQVSSHPAGLLDSIKMAHPDRMVVFSGPATLLRLVRLMKDKELSVPLFTTLAALDENVIPEKETAELRNVIFISPARYDDPNYLAFRKEFSFAGSKYPGPVAAYAYDGMMMLIRAITESGVQDYLKIKESLSKMDYRGVTGRIHFDDMGNRTGVFYLAQIRDGNLVTMQNSLP